MFGIGDFDKYVPDGKNATSLVKVGLTGDTTDALLEDRRDLSRRSLSRGKTSGKSRLCNWLD
jgi:hypothetical protein